MCVIFWLYFFTVTYWTIIFLLYNNTTLDYNTEYFLLSDKDKRKKDKISALWHRVRISFLLCMIFNSQDNAIYTSNQQKD